MADSSPRHGSGSQDTAFAVAIFGGVAVLSGGLGALIGGTPRALGTGVLGPWAGLAVGHQDCTMATQMPSISIGPVLVGAALLVGLSVAPFALRVTLLVAFAFWSLAWTALGILSMLNAAL